MSGGEGGGEGKGTQSDGKDGDTPLCVSISSGWWCSGPPWVSRAPGTQGLIPETATVANRGGENLVAELCLVDRGLGVIATPREPPTSGSISSTGGRPCRKRGVKLPPPPPPPSMALVPADRENWRVEIRGNVFGP